MIRLRPAALSAFILFAGVAGVDAQSEESPNEGLISEVAARAELDHLYRTLQASHFDLYAHRSREGYDEYYREARRSIDAPMSRLDVVRLFTPFVAFGRIGHARIDFPVREYIEYIETEGTLLPLDIAVADGHLIITHNYSGSPVLQPGARVVSLNGLSGPEWIERTSRYVSAERGYMAHAQLEAMFPRLVWLDEVRIDSFEISVQTPSGAVTSVTVDALPAMEVEGQKGVRERARLERIWRLLPDGVAYLRPGPFYAAEEVETLASFEAFIDEAFRHFVSVEAPDLILDLRSNPGGDNSFSDPMIAWFADRPFRFASRFEVKASPETRRVLGDLAEEAPSGVSAQMLDAMGRHQDGEAFEFAIPMARPRGDDRYSGRVWALVDRHSYSNATTVAAIIQDYGFGTVVGEETADLPTSYASSAQFTLPETGIVVTYPKGYFVRPSGDEELRGVVPDHLVSFREIPNDEDHILREVLQHILSQRSGGGK